MIDEKTRKQLFEKAKEYMHKAYCPYSHFRVGACVLGNDGKLYGGCNIENASYRLTQCAEGTAIGNMVSSGERKIKAIAIVAQSEELVSPCGACRQQIREFAEDDTLVYMCNEQGAFEVETIGSLLIRSFGPKHLENHYEYV